MKAKVVELDFKAVGQGAKGPYTFTQLVVQAPPWKGTPKAPRTVKLFPWDDKAAIVIKQLEDLKIAVGDDIEYQCDDSKWKNIVSVSKVNGPPSPDYGQTPQPQQKQTQGNTYNKDDDEVGKRIARSTALKAGIDLVGAKMTSGKGDGITAKVKPEVLEDMVLAYSDAFFNYLWDGPKNLEVDLTGVGNVDDLPIDEDVPF